MTDTISIPVPVARQNRTSRVSRHRISTTPPRYTNTNQVEEEDFLSEEESDDEAYLHDSTVQLLFNKIYVDPLQDVFEAIDGEAGNILRTGRFGVTGDTGSMDLLQPLLFSLQATEEDLTLLLPQLMQNPFFNAPSCSSPSAVEFFTIQPQYVWTNACIRLGVKVDSIIYEVLSSFCAKGPGSKQADALIGTALKTKYSVANNLQMAKQRWLNGPPLIAYQVPNSPLLDENDLCDNVSSEDESGVADQQPLEQQQLNVVPSKTRQDKTSSTSSGVGSSIAQDSSEAIPEDTVIDPEFPPYRIKRSSSSTMQDRITSLSSTSRKDSVIGLPSMPRNQNKHSTSSDRRESDGSIMSNTSILGRDNHWQVDIDSPANDMIIGSYSDNTYSILMWNPKFTVEFELGSEDDGMCSSTYCVDAAITKPTVSLHVKNPYDYTIAFAIRAHRQSQMFRSHVIFPREGLKTLDAREEFLQDFDVVGTEGIKRDEHIIIDLLICKLHGEPSWNVHRRYVILKCTDEDKRQASEQRLLKKLFDGGSPIQPGHHKDLTATLKQVILHGLQCVVKNKIEEAEIIFTQALHLPLFQRLTLKAFAYICLAVIADKRRKKFNTHRVQHIFKIVVELDKLLDACDSTAAPQLQMPKTIALIKQLKKELNLKKILDSAKSRSRADSTQAGRVDETGTIQPQGGMIELDETSLFIPGGAVSQETKVTLSNLSKAEIHQTLQTSHWASMLKIVTAFNIACSPPITHFNTPIIASITLPYEKHMPQPPFRLLQSKFMNNWLDITDEPGSDVTLNNKTLTVRTSHTGWILVASMNLDLSQILQIAVKSVFAEEPITLQVNVFGRSLSDNLVEVTAFITPATKEDSILNQKKDPPTADHRRISFPHSFKAYKGQKLRLEIHGEFDEQGLFGVEHIVDGHLEAVMTKDIEFLSATSKATNGKLIVTKYCNVHSKWETVQDVRLTFSSVTDANTQI